ncbi:MAG: CehA/McbA family metallohydrolase [Gemmatimonadota bacterium]|nr:CehA/McbA family metallohydrolase [Gemmatimonadota bacterium]
MHFRSVCGATALCLSVGLSNFAGAQQPLRWFKGNTHTHSLNSDGDSPALDVARWYRTHGYQFTFMTDHEFVTDVAPLNAMFGGPARFLAISAQEVTQRTSDPSHPEGVRQAHINALGINTMIRPLGERYIANQSIASTYARNIAEIRKQGGVAQVNHPNFRWSVKLSEMVDLPDSTLLEVWNGHSTVNNLGGTDSSGNVFPSHEAVWDSLLTRGKVIWGVADDDSHSFKPEDADKLELTRPGRGWVVVRADTLTPGAIVGALRRGDFYSSTGVTLRTLAASRSELKIEIALNSDARYRTEFVGRGGRVLATVHGLNARYAITGNEGYVRARITDSNGLKAWTQPVIIR